MTDVEVAQMNSLKEVGISIPKIYQEFAQQVGGFNLVRNTRRCIGSNSWEVAEGGDHRRVLERFLECMKGRSSKAVITYGDPAMRGAIAEPLAQILNNPGSEAKARPFRRINGGPDGFGPILTARPRVNAQTTARCESEHAMLERFFESRYEIFDFITNFQRCVPRRTDMETLSDALLLRRWSRGAKTGIQVERVLSGTGDSALMRCFVNPRSRQV
ncbi:hypothetical protein PIB30_079125 [Stylosanthes scabra]|uniref:Uncharacterized protein n=1 Tax=Stylosanthes scabra TaxID=79078 RepID=A0ABU6USB7_9FABA|nr:hypothetical protein [Stylosanthes scabra]